MRKILISTVFAVFFSTVFAEADQDGSYSYEAPVQQNVIKSPPLQKGSNASFDTRLPPVLPGEVVNDGHSKTKVWSTAGSVSSGAVPNAPQAPSIPQNGAYQNNGAAIGGVIVDDRRGSRR